MSLSCAVYETGLLLFLLELGACLTSDSQHSFVSNVTVQTVRCMLYRCKLQHGLR